MGRYIRAATLSDLPSDSGRVVEVEGEEIALFRTGESVCALENLCPHREGPIGEGDREGDVVVCPWHGWEIDIRSGGWCTGRS